MMKAPLFCGERVHLVAPNPEADAETLARWSRDSEYLRLFGGGPARPWTAKSTKGEIEKDLERDDLFLFFIRTLHDERLIGLVDLEAIWPHGDGWIGIGLGERDYWGKGYGSDAMRVLLRYAFTELNLHRVSLSVFAYNARAIRSYEKAGFVVEGRARQPINRNARRWDLIHMGILREEWLGSVISDQ